MQNQIIEKSSPAGEGSSLKTRYLTKLTSNALVLLANVVMQSLIPRALGPASYGNFNFITNFFQQLIGFLNLNTSTTFYTKLSQRQDDKGLVKFYLAIILAMGIIVAAFVMAGLALGMRQAIWPDQDIVFIILGAAWAFLSFCFAVFCEMSDAYGLTVKAEIAKLALKLCGLAAIVAMFWLKILDLGNFFGCQIILLIVSIFLMVSIFYRNGHPFQLERQLERAEWRNYGAEFIKFCLPLVVFTSVATLQGLLERWLLQKISGSTEQGFYGLAFQIGSICFLFTSAMIPLLAREYSISFSKNDLQEMKRLFLRFVPMLYAITAYFGCFLAVQSSNVMLLFGGKHYSGAVLPIALMCFYPLHQTYGQMNASLFFAAGRTVAYRNIGIAISLLSLPCTFFLVGPSQYGALQGGAVGLAVKMVAIQFLSTNLQLVYLSRLLHLPFFRLLGHQMATMLLFTAVAVVAWYVVELALHDGSPLERFMFSGAVYSAGIALLVFGIPSLCALSRDDLVRLLAGIRIGRRSLTGD